MENIAEMDAVSKRYGERLALDSFSLQVRRGEAIALLGRNGAGKSTALSIMQGLRPPTSGTAHLFGCKAGSAHAMARVGVTPQETDFPPQLTPRELIAFAAAHFQHSLNIDEIAAAYGLEQLIDRRVAGFSGGEKRRVAIALAFAGKPELVFLDEPTAGLDVSSQRAFNSQARAFVDAGGTLILTSHNLVEIEHVCSRVVLIDQGRNRLDGTIAEIRAAVGFRTIRFSCAQPTPFITKQFTSDGADRYAATLADTESILRRLFAETAPIENFTVEPLALDLAIDRLAAA